MKKIFFILSFILSVTLMPAQEKAKSIFDIARSGTVTEVKELMKQNPNIINENNENGFSPLILACYRGNIEVAKFLIDNVKDVNYKSQEGTALAGLSVKYNKELAEDLLKKGANPNIADSTGFTPLFWAVKFGNVNLVELLLKHKADKSVKDSQGMTPFEYALQTNNKDIINLLKN
ncbi:ankyrin repeat domain-containing protein [Chryseobacterium sp. Ch-15]|uniref:Ankyrin repeat domain-containing protein n=1 Tax=Chryseobacterium muglaense TaxID=2893752 RepID=A0A9Q3UXE3_9FLAO|nr:ankyrin repeat domain-containing protein [Chryseobacterium muglaense]MBD3905868.1 ankyrin repeat domain-containing protein [Chryseobacterium muglaense]MCC9035748.1 ankyrin repeat domain-containing protein [Chryseobacterium muglaense]MCM2555458.1 ankyrin repeat domain-containing protein [Chryseobacterium muglaense]